MISVRSFINKIQPTEGDAYERLKERMTESYAKTRWQQAFEHPDLGDRRPSMMMNEMLALLPAGARADDTLFLALFLLRPPVSLRDRLAASNHKTAADMARRADVLWDVRSCISAVTVAAAAPIDAVSRSPGRSDRRRSPDCRHSPDHLQNQRGRSHRRLTPGPSDTSKSLCYYQSRFR